MTTSVTVTKTEDAGWDVYAAVINRDAHGNPIADFNHIEKLDLHEIREFTLHDSQELRVYEVERD